MLLSIPFFILAGTNPATGVPYEQELCAITTPKGIAVLGDSASAHFHVPPQYIEAQYINATTYADVLNILENEFDWFVSLTLL